MELIRSASVLPVVFVTMFLSLGAGISNAEVRDLGHVCIDVLYDNVGRPADIHIFGALAYGARQQYIVLTGAVGLASFEHGSAVLTGDTITITFSGSSTSGGFFTTSTTNIILSASTLTGPVTTVITQLSPSLGSTRLTGTASAFSCN